jgi:hypothetical protein
MNPELRRHLWLDAQPRRLIIGWAGLAGLFLVVWLIDRGRDPHAFVFAGGLAFVIGALIWSPREARAAVTDEVHARTWDFQRLSALSAWSMTWGKLVGSAARPWAFAAPGLLIAALQLASISSVSHALFWVLTALGLGVFMQASGLAVGLIEIRKSRAVGKPPGLRSAGLWIVTLCLLVLGAAVWVHTHAVWTIHIQTGTLTASGQPLIWWGGRYEPVRFAAVSLIAAAVLGVGWAWRLMRLELQLRNFPWAWALFVALAALYVAGFDPPADSDASVLEHRLTFAGAALSALAYLGALIEPADRVRARQFIDAVLSVRPDRIVWTAPLIAEPTALAILVLVWDAGVRAGDMGRPSALMTLAGLAFLLRDLGVIAALRFGPRGRSDATVIISLILLYVVGAAAGSLFAGAHGQALFIPSLDPPGLSGLAGLVEAALVWTYALWRIGRPAKAPLRPPSFQAPTEKTAPASGEAAVAHSEPIDLARPTGADPL